jgi:hypothetical protein
MNVKKEADSIFLAAEKNKDLSSKEVNKEIFDVFNIPYADIKKSFSDLKGTEKIIAGSQGDPDNTYTTITGLIDKDYFEKQLFDSEKLDKAERQLQQNMYYYSGPGEAYTKGSVKLKMQGEKIFFKLYKEHGYDV